MEISKKKKGSKGGRGCKFDLLTILAVIFIMCLAAVPGFSAFAQDDISQSTGIVGNGRYLGGKTSDGQATVPMLGIDSNGNTVINALPGKSVIVSVAKTPVTTTGSTGGVSNAPVNAAVFVATPVAGTNVLVPGYNIPAGTPTAGTKVFIGPATPIPNTNYIFYNSAAASVQLAVPTVATMNGATQGGYMAVAPRTSAECRYPSATNVDCRLFVNPTPAGP